SSNQKYTTHIIEVQQNGNSGQIVWEWHIFDHMIQDVDSNKPGFGVVANHPELMDINVPVAGFGPFSSDWFHCNGIDYNPTLDQIVFTSRFLSEFFIIDHSTTTAEAATHTGGNAGNGGDFLYRWGNPGNYKSTFGVQRIPAAVHDPRWIKDDGRPNGGYIQFFNNEGNNGNSSVDAINPPRVGLNYTFNASSGYAPLNYDWRHNCIVSAWGQSASDRMANGNLFVNVSGEHMYEVDTMGMVVWQYAAGPVKAFRYACDDPGIIALLGASPCGVVAVDDADLSEINLFPNPSTGVFKLSGIPSHYQSVEITVFDVFGHQVLSLENTDVIDLAVQANGVYFVSIRIDESPIISKKISLLH
ncbi:MAG TPA: T9SS type A sorting domain-containing protein, partial [Bacteroidetes bacterium]|nr:T9SS type A sorting domain-containing protein [Bacteroidota bacterium]